MTALADLILGAMRRNSWSRGDLARRLGYVDSGRALRRLDGFIAGETPDAVQTTRLAKALAVSEAEVTAAIEATRAATAKRQREDVEARERAARETFLPHAWAITRRTTPSPIFAVAIFGPAYFRRVDLPDRITDHTEADLIRVVGEHCRAHYARWKGRAGPFAEILAYHFRVNPDVTWSFSTGGDLISTRSEAQECCSRASLSLLNGRLLTPVLPQRECKTG
jgi:hypothetical protein